jgi:hypothetical protein
MESQEMYELTLMTSSVYLEAVLRTKYIALTAVRQSRWILKQLCDADLQVNADKFNILPTLTEYLDVLTSNRPQSNKA